MYKIELVTIKDDLEGHNDFYKVETGKEVIGIDAVGNTINADKIIYLQIEMSLEQVQKLKDKCDIILSGNYKEPEMIDPRDLLDLDDEDME